MRQVIPCKCDMIGFYIIGVKSQYPEPGKLAGYRITEIQRQKY
jgi:hypothetical protein